MKYEYARETLFNFYCTSAKACFINSGNIVDKKAKGIMRYVIKNLLSEAD